MSSRIQNLLTLLVLAVLALAPVGEAALFASAPIPFRGTVFMTRDEALALAFPECEIERGTNYLTQEQVDEIAKLAGVKFEAKIVHPYVARKEGKLVGTAYFDAHRVRTLRESIMVVIQPDGKIGRIEVLSFGEPVDYIPRDSWYAQFNGNKLSDELQLKRKIKTVTGATLTARATTDGARRILALHQTLEKIAKEKEAARKKREEARRKKKQEEKKDPPTGPSRR